MTDREKRRWTIGESLLLLVVRLPENRESERHLDVQYSSTRTG